MIPDYVPLTSAHSHRGKFHKVVTLFFSFREFVQPLEKQLRLTPCNKSGGGRDFVFFAVLAEGSFAIFSAYLTRCQSHRLRQGLREGLRCAGCEPQ
jgi:hypothetical protein